MVKMNGVRVRACVRRGGGSRVAIAVKAFLLVASFATSTFAASTRPLADANGDGLIEIYDLEDLDAIRNAPLGDNIYGMTSGCPAAGCSGFVLINDLDFDTSGNGTVDDDDDFFTHISRDGWEPIPTLQATFDGGGRTISHLTQVGYGGSLMNYPQFDRGIPGGLFSVLDGADVFNLHLVDVDLDDVGPNTGTLAGAALGASFVTQVSVERGRIYSGGESMIGGVVGNCSGSDLEESYTDLLVQPSGEIGGLIGQADDCFVARSFVLGKTVSSRYHGYIGGLVGYMTDGGIEDSYVAGSVGEGAHFGGLIGESVGSPFIRNSYISGAVIGDSAPGAAMLGVGQGTFVSSFYATDTTGYEKTSVSGDQATAVTLADLQCPTSVGDTGCRPGLFAGWDATLNSDGQPAWDFGTALQVPALRIRGVIVRDSDGDGVIDADDDFPNNWAASLDTDGDGAIDFWRDGCEEECRSGSGLVLDQFPYEVAASLDTDLDGLPDAWNPTCNASCRAGSGLSLDPSLDDLDNDGIADLVDQDDDGDSEPDVDLDSDGLIDINTLEDLAFVNYDPSGASRRTQDFYGDGIPLEDASGCPPRIVRGILARECNGYELLADLDFNTDGVGGIDAGDDYWNGGFGWQPLGHLGDDKRMAFQTNFEGNGHTIKNLYVNRGMESGLFGGVRGANIRNLGVVGDLGEVGGDGAMTGVLVGDSKGATITNCYSTGRVVTSGGNIGGLVGRGESITITGSFSIGQVAGNNSGTCNTGGLIGIAEHDSTITASFASGFTSELCGAGSTVGGLVGLVDDPAVVSGSYSIGPVSGTTDQVGGLIGFTNANAVSSYWATDTSNVSTSAGNATGVLVSGLECPTEPDDTGCVPGVPLFTGWDQYVQSGNLPYWDQGTSSELPGLCLGGTLYRVNWLGALQPTTACPCTTSEQELVTNRGFESNTSGWTALGSSLSSSTLQKHGGARSLRIANRTQAWSGAQYNLAGLATPGETLSASLWARITGDPNEPVLLTLRSTCQGAATEYTRVAERTATSTKWVKLAGSVEIPNCQLSELVLYAEGPRPGVVLYIDDVSVESTNLSCSGSGGGSGSLDGSYVVYSSWTEGYCVEMVVTNPTAMATTNWSAVVNLNGTTIDPNNYWNLNTSGFSGTVTLTPQYSWGAEIPAGGHTYSLGFCGIRPPGNASLPGVPVVTASF